MRRRVPVLAPLVLALLPVVGGCSSCDKDKPYVPYEIDPHASAGIRSSASAVDSIAPPPSKEPREQFEAMEAKRVKGSPAEMKTTAGRVAAPRGTVFELLLESDVTADDKPDVVGWMRSERGTAGELVHFAPAPGGGGLRPRTLVPLPANLTLEPGCEAATDLRQVGPRTLAMTYRRTCTAERAERTTEWVAVVVPVRDPALRLAFVTDQPSEGERLAVSLDGLDRDGDGFDDLLASFRLTGTPGNFGEPEPAEVRVRLHYFDRPAGLSRDPHEPAASFDSLARTLDRLADGPKRGKVAPTAREARRIHRMLCAGAGRPRVRVGGAPLQCGATDALRRMARAEVDALLASDRVVAALGAFDRLQAAGASAKQTDAAKKAIAKRVPDQRADSYFLPFGPGGTGERLAWGALAFDADGALMIRGNDSVMRFDPKTRVAVADPASGPVSPWATRVQAPGGRTLTSVFDPCDGGLLQVRSEGDGDGRTTVLPVDPVTTRGCGPATPRLVPAQPVGKLAGGLSLIVAGTPVWVAADGSRAEARPPAKEAGEKGGPRSPDGKHLAHASRLGVLVVGEDGGGRRWRSSSMASGYERLRGCTVSNQAEAVACIDGSRTRVFLPSKE